MRQMTTLKVFQPLEAETGETVQQLAKCVTSHSFMGELQRESHS